MLKLHRLCWPALLGLLFFCAMPLSAQAQGSYGCPRCGGFGSDMRAVLTSSAPEEIEIERLDDKRNPYADEYEPWDLWIYEHAVTSTSASVQRYFREEGGRGNTLLSAYVDASGYLVPQRVAEMRQLHAWAEGDQPGNYPTRWTHVLAAAGPIDPELRERYEQAMLALRAEYALRIPDWVVALKPAWVLVLPPAAGPYAGEVVVYGTPGSNQQFELGVGVHRPPHGREIFSRYSADGELLAKTKIGQEWWELYTVNPAAELKGGQESYYRVFENDGIVSVTDVRTGTRDRLMNFDGTLIPDVKNPTPRNRTHWQGMNARELAYLYGLQQGKVKPPARLKAKPKPMRDDAVRPKAPPMGGNR